MQRLTAELERRVALARSARPDYGELPHPLPAPELPAGCVTTIAAAALRELLAAWGLDAKRFGTPEWNPLGDLVAPGARVVLKPNWVAHRNYSGAGLDCLITHPSLIEAVLEYLALARPCEVVVGDAPYQSCDFETLLGYGGLAGILRRFGARAADFRRTVLDGSALGDQRSENCRGLEQYVLFDLAAESLLEPISARASKFRVTVYNPDLLLRTHAAGRHQYLVAREVIDAGLVINLPKLKTHKKACITGALKNLIGINGNKEFLPHHCKGGTLAGGDCYAGRSRLKAAAEEILDLANRRPPGGAQRALARAADIAVGCAARLGHDRNLEGSWYGNDTIWRTCLDLLRILAYGRPDGTLTPEPQRGVVTITDAIIAGEGEGPLAPVPAPIGLLTGALNPAAAEWVHARLMGFDPGRIPLVREAFGQFKWPLAEFAPDAIRVRTCAGEIPGDQAAAVRNFRPPEGWRGHCEAC